ncbi:MAG: alpha/beta hydrolase [Candidatus Omnitrophica bacterium]|nr:alpha/beta hydrolase [Candidatus Omnitrophota bacterium]MCM8828944.1 alpha/beta hydrolase [Candidatus Omnitrophota bacterium]
MKEIKVTTLNGFNEKLVGIMTIPALEKAKYPAVILVHGFGVTKEESGMFDDIAKNVSDANFLVYRFDFSGCGESEGNYNKTSLSKLKSDLSAILDFVKSQSKVETSRIGILAQSFGTSTTIALEPEVKCLVMMGSISHPKEILGMLFGDGYDPDGISKFWTLEIEPQFWKDFDNYDLLKSIKQIHSPILFIHGEKDDIVPPYEMEAYFEIANEPKQKIIIEGANHGLEPGREKVYRIVVDWFKKHLV